MNKLYRIGGKTALMAVAIVFLDIAISFGGVDFSPDAMTAFDWFVFLKDNSFFGLRTLGMQLFLALYAVHCREKRTFAALSLILYLIRAAVYIANNAAIPMLVISGKYAASADAQRTLLAAAGKAIIAKGADFKPGSFIGFFLTEIAGMVFSFIMLRCGIFGKAAAYSGIAGIGLLAVFTVCQTFVPVLFATAMIIAAIGGILSLVWYALKDVL